MSEVIREPKWKHSGTTQVTATPSERSNQYPQSTQGRLRSVTDDKKRYLSRNTADGAVLSEVSFAFNKSIFSLVCNK